MPEYLTDDPWFKVVEMLQQNWAIVIPTRLGVRVVFYGDTCGVFDELEFPLEQAAETALRRNGFGKFSEDPEAAKRLSVPKGEFYWRDHPNGRIYSSGRFWR